jgi:DNA polymerase-1
MAYLRAADQVGVRGGQLRTYGGRLLRFGRQQPDDDDGLGAGRRGRYARNAVIQGAAAELFKAWAATVRAGLPAPEGQIVLCLHDELLLHVAEASADRAAALLHASLAATTRWWAAGSAVRFVAEVSSGATWAEAHG